MGPQDAETTETTPLVVPGDKTTGGDHHEKGQATVAETVLNLMKTCMGTGCLALAYACQQGGFVVFCVGLAGIAAWNIYSVDRLVRCRTYLIDLIQEDEAEEEAATSPTRTTTATTIASIPVATRKHPPERTSTLGKVAFYAFGPAGLEVMDILMILLLLGIIISYLSAVISFLSDTPLTVGPLGDAVIVALLMALLSLVPDLGHLSDFSATGLLVLAGTFVVIAGYGVYDFFYNTQEKVEEVPDLPVWPVSSVGMSHFFGVCVFGFGVVPLTYNFQESMVKPELIVKATAGALGGVALSYMLLGVGLSVLFPAVTGEVLHELPATGWLPTTTRLAMAFVVVLTAPLLIVPTGELLEGKFHGPKVLVRGGVCMVSVVVAVLLPTFVEVLAFVGCACVGFVSFCVPPILHIRLVWMRKDEAVLSMLALIFDLAMLLWGIIATVLGTIYTLG